MQARSEGKRVAILSGGELTVTVRGNGRGGPNQEYALALAALLKDTSGISALAGDTDGADGGAGSADRSGRRHHRCRAPSRGWIRSASIRKPISTTTTPPRSLPPTGDLLLTGPTLTNVNDIRVILVRSGMMIPSR